MLASDCAVLSEQISPELIFTNHMGQVSGKQEDLAMHRNGRAQIAYARTVGGSRAGKRTLGVVSVRMKLAGAFGDISPARRD